MQLKRITLIVLLFYNVCVGQQQVFQKTYGNDLDDWFSSIEIINDSDFYMVGYTRENDPMNNTILICKLNSYGELRWTKSVNIGTSDFILKVKIISDGSLFLTGYTYDYIQPEDADMLTIKIDTSGNIHSKMNWGSLTNEFLEKSIETFDDGIISIGNITYFTSRIWGGLNICKQNVTGQILWSKTKLFDDSAFPKDIQQVNTNKYFISGSTSQFRFRNEEDNLFLAEMDSSGEIRWAKGFGGNYQEYPGYLSIANDRGILAATTSFSFDSNGYSDIMIIKTDSIGNTIWSKKYGSSKNEILNGILRDTAGGYILWGSSSSFYPSFKGTGFIFKIDEDGNIAWSRLYGSNSSTKIFDVKQVDKQFLICGQTQSTKLPVNLDGYFVRANWEGISGCNDTMIVLPYESVNINSYNVSFRDTTINYSENNSYNDLSLNINEATICNGHVSIHEYSSFIEQNEIFPNPNKGTFFLKYSESTQLPLINIYNTLGQKINFNKSLLDNNLIEINLKELRGIFFVQIIHDNKFFTAKIIAE